MELKILHYEKLWLTVSVCIMITIFVQSSFPSVVNNSAFYQFQFDKIVHMSGWLSLAFSLRSGLNKYFVNQVERNRQILLLLLILFCIVYGISDEMHQLFVPSRTSDILDVIADSIGSIIGAFIAHFLLSN